MNLQDALPGTLHFGTFDDDILHAPPGDHWLFGLAGLYFDAGNDVWVF